MMAHEGLRHRRQLFEDLVVEIGEADLAARTEDAVLDDEPVEFALSRIGQRVPGRPQSSPRSRRLSTATASLFSRSSR